MAIYDHSALWAFLFRSPSRGCLLCTLLFMDLIALYNILQKLITPESNTSFWHASTELLWPISVMLETGSSEHTAATLQSILLSCERGKKNRSGSYYLKCIVIKSHLRGINGTCVMSQRRLDTYSLSQWHFLMLHAAGPITCVPRLLLYFQQVSVLKLSGGPLNVCSDNSEGLPLIFHLPLPPPVRCPFQSLIYGPHKCARDAEISEEVINRTRTKKRGGTRKQTEEVTGTCRVKAQV